MSNTKALNIVCSRADYDSIMYSVHIYVGGRIGCILVIDGGIALSSSDLSNVGLNYGWAKIYENTDLAVQSVSAIKENNNARIKITMANTRSDYRAQIVPLSATAASGGAMYSASWATS